MQTPAPQSKERLLRWPSCMGRGHPWLSHLPQPHRGNFSVGGPTPNAPHAPIPPAICQIRAHAARSATGTSLPPPGGAVQTLVTPTSPCPMDGVVPQATPLTPKPTPGCGIKQNAPAALAVPCAHAGRRSHPTASAGPQRLARSPRGPGYVPGYF